MVANEPPQNDPRKNAPPKDAPFQSAPTKDARPNGHQPKDAPAAKAPAHGQRQTGEGARSRPDADQRRPHQPAANAPGAAASASGELKAAAPTGAARPAATARPGRPAAQPTRPPMRPERPDNDPAGAVGGPATGTPPPGRALALRKPGATTSSTAASSAKTSAKTPAKTPAAAKPKGSDSPSAQSGSAAVLAKPDKTRISGPTRAARPARLSRVARSITADIAPMEEEDDAPDPLWLIVVGLARLAAAALIALTFAVWGRVIGVFPSPLALSWYGPEGPWLATVVAAILFPVAAVGLWLLARWGAVILMATLGLLAGNAFAGIGLIPHGGLVLALLVALSGALAVLSTVRAIKVRREQEETI